MSCCQIYGALAGKVAQEGGLDCVNITKVRYRWGQAMPQLIIPKYLCRPVVSIAESGFIQGRPIMSIRGILIGVIILFCLRLAFCGGSDSKVEGLQEVVFDKIGGTVRAVFIFEDGWACMAS